MEDGAVGQGKWVQSPGLGVMGWTFLGLGKGN